MSCSNWSQSTSCGSRFSLQRIEVALLPVLDDVDQQRAGPADAALEEGDVQIGEAPGDAAEEQRLAQPVHALGEEADVVEDVAGDRRERVRRDVADAAVEDRREAAVAQGLPDRVVVVRAVEAEGVEPVRLTWHAGTATASSGSGRGIGRVTPSGRPTTFEPELAAVRELGDRLLGRDHRHHAGDRHPIGERPVRLREERIEAAAQPDPHVLVLNPSSTKGFRGIEHAEVDAQLGQPLVQQRRDRGRRQVDRLGCRIAPPGALRRPRLLTRSAVRGAAHDASDGRRLGPVLLEELRPERLAQIRQRGRHELQHVTVGVDHRMVELLAYLLWTASVRTSGSDPSSKYPAVARSGHVLAVGRGRAWPSTGPDPDVFDADARRDEPVGAAGKVDDALERAGADGRRVEGDQIGDGAGRDAAAAGQAVDLRRVGR